MDLDAYVAEHDGEWRRLEQLARGPRLSTAEADELVMLYQRAATHLSVVRSRSPDPALVARLSRLVLTARATITGGSRFSWQEVGRFFTVRFPLAVYLAWPWWTGVAAAFLLISGFLMGWVTAHPETADTLIGSDAVRDIADRSFAGYYTRSAAHVFAFSVWTNNAWVAAQCLAAGVLVLPVGYVLWQNALNLGVMGGIMIGHGRADVFFGLIAPHGLLELTAVFVAAGAGLRIGWAWIAPGPARTRAQSLAETARAGMVVALGLVLVFAVAGCIEAFVTPSPLPTPARIGIGATAWGAFLLYVVILGRRAIASGASTEAPN